MNDAMSLGLHRVWKQTFVNDMNIHSPVRILDVASGTGDIAFTILDRIKDNLNDDFVDVHPQEK